MPSKRSAWPDREIAATAERQAANITHHQLQTLGVRPSLIAAALRRGRLHPVHVGVHSLVPVGARPPHAAEHAALLACGEGAILSHWTAAELHRLELALRRRGGPVELTVVGVDRARRRAGLRVHRTSVIDPSERTRVAGLPVASVARVVLELAPSLNDEGLEQLVDQALHKTSRAKLRAAAERRAGRPGAARVLRLLDPARPSSDAWSRSEGGLRRMIIGADLPAPETNQPVGPYIVDLMWRRQRVIVEYDSDRWHSSARARRRDAARHNDLTSWGWSVLHVTWPQLRDHPERVLVWIAVKLSQSGWSPAG